MRFYWINLKNNAKILKKTHLHSSCLIAFNTAKNVLTDQLPQHSELSYLSRHIGSVRKKVNHNDLYRVIKIVFITFCFK